MRLKSLLMSVFIPATTIFALSCVSGTASAADLSSVQGSDTTPGYIVDDSGTVTGNAGDTYYNVNKWQDMMDTYKSVSGKGTPHQVVFNIIGDVPGDTGFRGGAPIVNGYGVTIKGNGHTIYAGYDANAKKNMGRNNVAGFWANASTIDGNTTLELDDAQVVNANANGIFPITGYSTAVTKYKDVSYKNGNSLGGASPLRNDRGQILLYGNNTFDIFESSDGAGIDNQGEWIQGGYDVEVISGTTILNQSWGTDQPYYVYNNTGHTMKIHDNSNLVWNLDYTYTMYYDDGNSGPANWDIGKNASFKINGTAKTASRNNNWFMSSAFNAFNINVAEKGDFEVTTGGGSINLDGINGPTKWNFGKDSTVLLDNLNSRASLITGTPKSGSEMNIKDADSVTLKTAGGTVFNSVAKIPINITGQGMRLHASKSADANSSDDLYKRITTGETDGTFSSANMSPSEYTVDDLSYLKTAKYIRWYYPDGLGFNNSSMDRLFNVNLGNLPRDGRMSDTISGADNMMLNFKDDRGLNPNYSVQVSLLSNQTPDSTSYFWKNPGSADVTQLTGNPLTILKITDDANLPSNVKMTDAGENYSATYDKDEGLLLKSNYSLTVQQSENAKIQYTLVDGPQS